MELEVELKFPISDCQALVAALAQLGCRFGPPLEQADVYFAHPTRDFAATDEALRLRRSGDQACITYKGPKLDPQTKTRREIEVPLPSGSYGFAQSCELLAALGFRRVLEVRKTRTPGQLQWQEAAVEVALDDVADLGSYVELELLATFDRLDAARNTITSLAAKLGLSGSERRGYLDLLLQKQAVGSDRPMTGGGHPSY